MTNGERLTPRQIAENKKEARAQAIVNLNSESLTNYALPVLMGTQYGNLSTEIGRYALKKVPDKNAWDVFSRHLGEGGALSLQDIQRQCARIVLESLPNLYVEDLIRPGKKIKKSYSGKCLGELPKSDREKITQLYSQNLTINGIKKYFEQTAGRANKSLEGILNGSIPVEEPQGYEYAQAA